MYFFAVLDKQYVYRSS